MISIEILNANVIKTLNRDMQKLASDFAGKRNLREPFERIRDEVVIPSIRLNFEVGGRTAKGRWEEIAPVTLARRQSGWNYPPLTDTGQMSRAAVAKARFKIAANTMTYGNWPEKRWFGPVHDLVELAARAQIPHRPFAIFQPEDIVQIGEIMMEWVEERTNARIRKVYV